VKRDGDAWKLVEPKAAPTEFDLEQVANQVASLLRTKASRLAADAPKTAMAKTSPVVEVELKNGKKQTLRFGAPVPVEDPPPNAGATAKPPEPREYFAKGGLDDLVYAVPAFAKTRFEKPAELFKKPPAPPSGMGGMPGHIPGMENLPPDVRKKLEESMKKGDFPHP